jgi:hypothetical protein
MTMQLAFEAFSADADRLSFRERAERMRVPMRRCIARMPHVDDLLFAVALAGLLAVAVGPLRDGIDYAAGATPVAVSAAALRGAG